MPFGNIQMMDSTFLLFTKRIRVWNNYGHCTTFLGCVLYVKVSQLSQKVVSKDLLLFKVKVFFIIKFSRIPIKCPSSYITITDTRIYSNVPNICGGLQIFNTRYFLECSFIVKKNLHCLRCSKLVPQTLHNSSENLQILMI